MFVCLFDGVLTPLSTWHDILTELEELCTFQKKIWPSKG